MAGLLLSISPRNARLAPLATLPAFSPLAIADGTTHKFVVDQTVVAEGGLDLGSFELAADKEHSLVILNKGANGFVVADASTFSLFVLV